MSDEKLADDTALSEFENCLQGFKFDPSSKRPSSLSSKSNGGLLTRRPESFSEFVNYDPEPPEKENILVEQEALFTTVCAADSMNDKLSQRPSTAAKKTGNTRKKKAAPKPKKGTAPKSITARLALRYHILDHENAQNSNEEDMSEDFDSDNIPFTQLAAKQHKEEFSVMAKLSGKKSKSKAMSRVSAKITSRKTRQDYQLTLNRELVLDSKTPATNNEDEMIGNGDELNTSILLRSAASGNSMLTNVSFENIVCPYLGAKIAQNATLSFPFVPRSSSTIKHFESIEILMERYNDAASTDLSSTAKLSHFCDFYPKPKSLFYYSAISPSMTKELVLSLHKDDKDYFTLDLESSRKRKRAATAEAREHAKKLTSVITHVSDSDINENEEPEWSTEDDLPPFSQVKASDEDEYEEIEVVSESTWNKLVILINSSPDLTHQVPILSQELTISPLKSKSLDGLTLMSDRVELPLDFSENFPNNPRDRLQSPPIPFVSNLLENDGDDVLSSFQSTDFLRTRHSESPQPLALVTNKCSQTAIDCSTKSTQELTFPEDIEVIEIPESPYGSCCESEDLFQSIQNAAQRFSDTLGDTTQDHYKQISQSPAPPDFEKMSTRELKLQLDNWGFKPVKTRKKMIELLQSCKVTKEPRPQLETNSSVLIPVPNIANQMDNPPIRKVTSKVPSTQFADISDRTANDVRNCYPPSGGEVDIAAVGGDNREADGDSITNIWAQISAHLKSDQNTINSIWTRILCYEPVPLDELCTFLNTKMNKKMKPAFVRNWCDSHGVTTTMKNDRIPS